MKVYLAGRYSRRDELSEYAKLFQAAGISVTSRWLTEDTPLNSQMGDHSEEFYKTTAEIDIQDVLAADAIVFFAEDPLVGTPRGGRHVEFGYALGLGNKGLLVVGPKENIFHYLPGVRHFENVDGAIQYLFERERVNKLWCEARFGSFSSFEKLLEENAG